MKKIVTFKSPKKRLRYRRNCQNFTWNRGKIAKNWQNVKIAGNFAKIACDFCKNLIASLPSKIAELAINRGVWQHWRCFCNDVFVLIDFVTKNIASVARLRDLSPIPRFWRVSWRWDFCKNRTRFLRKFPRFWEISKFWQFFRDFT